MSSNSLSRSFAASDASRVVAALAVCAALVVPVPLLAQHAPEPIMPAHAIQRVMPIPDEVHEERYTKRGAVIGGLIGAAGGLAFGTLLGLLCEAEGDGCWAAVPLIGGAGAAGGALVGGILGYYDMTAPSLEFFGGSLGVGARVLPDVRGRWFIDVEARHSRNLQNIEPLRMNALLAGVGLYW